MVTQGALMMNPRCRENPTSSTLIRPHSTAIASLIADSVFEVGRPMLNVTEEQNHGLMAHISYSSLSLGLSSLYNRYSADVVTNDAVSISSSPRDSTRPGSVRPLPVPPKSIRRGSVSREGTYSARTNVSCANLTGTPGDIAKDRHIPDPISSSQHRHSMLIGGNSMVDIQDKDSTEQCDVLSLHSPHSVLRIAPPPPYTDFGQDSAS